MTLPSKILICWLHVGSVNDQPSNSTNTQAGSNVSSNIEIGIKHPCMLGRYTNWKLKVKTNLLMESKISIEN